MSTIRDVARAAGVSVATVSRVLNNNSRVTDATRSRVQAAAARLDYWPHGAARSLITKRTHTFGVLLPDLYGEFFSEVIRGIDLAVRRAGYHLLVSSSHSGTDELVAALLTMRGRIDGLIVMAPEEGASRSIRKSAPRVPIVLLNPDEHVPGCESISIANDEGARGIVRHLLAVGHRRIAAITGPQRNMDARQRLAGYRAALREAGVEWSAALEVPGDFTEPSGYEAARAVLRLEPRPTAVFVSNDKMAVGVMGALSDAGVRVPEDLAVAGFDDIPMAQFLNPPLTTVHVDAHRLGELAVQRLLKLDRGGPGTQPPHEVLPATLVVRGSCGARHPGPGVPRVHRSEVLHASAGGEPGGEGLGRRGSPGASPPGSASAGPAEE